MRALGQDERHGGEREHVVDHGRLAEQALVRRQRRLGAHDAALAFEALQQRRFLAAHVGAGADADLEIERVAASPATSGPSSPPRGATAIALLQRGDRVRIFRADVDEALGRADRETGDRHALDQTKGSPSMSMRSANVPLSPSSALQTMYFCSPRRIVHRLPLDAGREAGAAAAAQAGLRHFFDDLGRRHRQRLRQPLVAAERAVVLERHRIDEAAARERQARLRR